MQPLLEALEMLITYSCTPAVTFDRHCGFLACRTFSPSFLFFVLVFALLTILGKRSLSFLAGKVCEQLVPAKLSPEVIISSLGHHGRFHTAGLHRKQRIQVLKSTHQPQELSKEPLCSEKRARIAENGKCQRDCKIGIFPIRPQQFFRVYILSRSNA